MALKELIQRFTEAKFEDIPQTAIERAKRCFISGQGVGFLGYHVGDEPYLAYARDLGGAPQCTIVGDGSKVPLELGAGVNAQMAWSTDTKVTAFGAHLMDPYSHVALAIGEFLGASGKDVLTAFSVAYDVNGRFHHGVKRHETVPMPTIGNEGVGSYGDGNRHVAAVIALEAGKMLGLNETQMENAFGIAWQFAPLPDAVQMYTRLVNMTSIFSLCQIGIQAALLSQRGCEGPFAQTAHGYPWPYRDPLERETGLYHLENITNFKDPYPYYYVAEHLQIKPYIASAGALGAIELAADIVREEKLDPDAIEAVNFYGREMYATHFPYNYPQPKNFAEANLSIPWAMANNMLGIPVGPDWVSAERFQDRRVLDLAQKVRIVSDTQATHLWDTDKKFAPSLVNRVEVVAGGKTHVRETPADSILDTVKRPMPQDMVDGYFVREASPVIGDAQAAQLLSLLKDLDNVSDVRRVGDLLGPR